MVNTIQVHSKLLTPSKKDEVNRDVGALMTRELLRLKCGEVDAVALVCSDIHAFSEYCYMLGRRSDIIFETDLVEAFNAVCWHEQLHALPLLGHNLVQNQHFVIGIKRLENQFSVFGEVRYATPPVAGSLLAEQLLVRLEGSLNPELATCANLPAEMQRMVYKLSEQDCSNAALRLNELRKFSEHYEVAKQLLWQISPESRSVIFSMLSLLGEN